jgi:hypothetical protein
MTKSKRLKRQTIIYKTFHKKLSIDENAVWVFSVHSYMITVCFRQVFYFHLSIFLNTYLASSIALSLQSIWPHPWMYCRMNQCSYIGDSCIVVWTNVRTLVIDVLSYEPMFVHWWLMYCRMNQCSYIGD